VDKIAWIIVIYLGKLALIKEMLKKKKKKKKKKKLNCKEKQNLDFKAILYLLQLTINVINPRKNNLLEHD
jgi:putative Mn2+ efflux pump MntP